MESPLRPPPEGFVSNFDNPVFLGTPVVITAGTCIPVVIIFAILRFYARALVGRWTFQDYIFCVSCLLSIAYIAFSIPLTLAKPYGYHAWDINVEELNKSSMLRLQASAIALGPVLWFSKITIFSFLLHVFKSTRWFRNSVYSSVITTGIVYSVYTCTVTMACAPRPESDLQSYINGFKRDACSGPYGVNVIVSVIMGFVNCLTDLYLVAAALVLIPNLSLAVTRIRSAYLMLFVGAMACVCGFLGVVYRIKTWEDADITGYQIPLNVTIMMEIALTSIITCLPSINVIWHYYTDVNLNETTTIGSPSTRFTSALSYYQQSTPLSPPNTKSSWRKTHLSVEELPYRKASSEYPRSSIFGARDSRMKMLPCTPLPITIPTTPETPKSPNSIRSIRLPILLESSRE